MRSSFHNRLLMSAAVAALSLGTTQAMASGGADTQWATVDNHGFLGVDLMVEGGYLFGSGDLPYAEYWDGVSTHDFKMKPGDGWNGSASVTGRFECVWGVTLAYTGIRTSEDAGTGNYNGFNTPATWPIYNILGGAATSYNRMVSKTDVKADSFDLMIGHDVGPEIGANYSVPISDNGLGVFGSALGSILFGKQTTNTVATGAAVGTSSYSDSHVAYTIDAKAGVSYGGCLIQAA